MAFIGGGLSYSFLSTGAVQAVCVKATPGQVYSMEFFNNGATPMFVRLYDLTTAPAATDTPIWRGTIPGGASSIGATLLVEWTHGKKFAAGIGLRVTGAVADNDATVLVATAVSGNLNYR